MMNVNWDIRGEGRAWKADEARKRHDLVPGRLEMIEGRLCWSDEERIVLLGLLLENVGVDRAVQLGDAAVWRNAVARL